MLKALFYPGTIAVIGASRTPGKVGYSIVENLVRGDFEGEVVLINPSATEILGAPCFPDLKSYGKKIDLSVVVLPTGLVKEAVRDSIQAGAGAIVVITAGFKEVDEKGAILERELAALCESRGVRLMGPNCLGIINTENGMNASFAARMPKKGGISLLSQSGALATAILDLAAERHLGMAKLASIGNKADLNENDFISAFAEDPGTSVILGYLENIVSGDTFIKVAEAAALKRPNCLGIINTENGMNASFAAMMPKKGGISLLSQSGALATAILDLAAEQHLGMALVMQPLPGGDRVAIITNAGGAGNKSVNSRRRKSSEPIISTSLPAI